MTIEQNISNRVLPWLAFEVSLIQITTIEEENLN